jgi:quercetin dioxygenase-like cupin family protein
MQDGESAWVLGHKIRRWDTDDSYGLIEVTSLPKVPGPPPHFHKSEKEFFLILKGTLDVMADGKWESMGPGSFVELPTNTTHTFINNTDEDVVWITGWRPKGFQRFFKEFGVPVDQQDSFQKSISDEVVQRVIKECESFGMYVSR